MKKKKVSKIIKKLLEQEIDPKDALLLSLRSLAEKALSLKASDEKTSDDIKISVSAAAGAIDKANEISNAFRSSLWDLSQEVAKSRSLRTTPGAEKIRVEKEDVEEAVRAFQFGWYWDVHQKKDR